MADVVVALPEALRGELKEPLGAVYADADALLSAAGRPIIAVGDVVTAHLVGAGCHPAVALVDGRTEREAVDPEVAAAIEGFDHRVAVENPAATLSADLLAALSDAVDRPGNVLVRVDGEEDLAALPAVLVAPDGAAVVYGQPGEGMVLVTVDEARRDRCRDLLAAMDGDADRLSAILER
jgi:uncharacterized protein (UPF0218 family)